MKNEPFISIILVCYNYAHLLPRALKKIAQQTFRDFELVFVDNGSTDHSLEVARKFAEIHQDIPVNIIVIEKNDGIAKGENEGVKVARGKYLMFHDADDWMDDNTLEIISNAAKKNDADRVISSFRDIDQTGKILQEQRVAKKSPIYWLYGMQQANLFKRSIYQERRLYESGCFWIDTEKTLKFSQYIHRVAYVHEPCYNYLVHTDSTSRNKELYKLLWTPKYMFENFLKMGYEVYKEQEGSIHTEWIEYQLIKNYYSYIYQFLRDAPLHEKQKSYRKIHRIMLTYFPDYLRNPKISLIKGGGVRMYARIIIWCSALLERLHLMNLGLCLYHALSWFKYFQV